MNAKNVNVDLWSLTALQIEMYFGETLLSHATGSIWKRGGQEFLVTNWHNFTGKHRETDEHVSAKLAEPNKVRVYYHHQAGAGRYVWQDYPLLDDRGASRWLDDGNSQMKVDVAALPVDVPSTARVTFPEELPTERIIRAHSKRSARQYSSILFWCQHPDNCFRFA